MGPAQVSFHRLTRPGRAVAALLCLWVAAAHVHGGFDAIRLKLVRDPLPPQRSVVLPPAERPLTNPSRVLVYRARNDGPDAVELVTRAGNVVLDETRLVPGESSRVDVAWTVPAERGGELDLRIDGTTSAWTLEYAELANLHGFTRGAVEFLILPAGQPTARSPAWIALALAAWLALTLLVPPARWPAGAVRIHRTAVAIVFLFLAAVAVAPVVSSFRLALAPHTFAGALAVLGSRSIATMAVRAWRYARRAASSTSGAVIAEGRRMRDAVAAARQRAVAAVSTTTRGSRHVIGRAVRVLASVPWLRVAFAAALVAYAALLWVRVGAYAGGADQSGYLNSARLLANGQFRVAARIVDALPEGSVPGYLYAPLGFTTADGGSIVPTYPVGLPLLVAAVAPVTGWDAAADVTMVVHALAGVLLTFWLARACGLSPGLAGLAGLLLATSPLYLFMSLTLMSDTPAMVWVCAAILLAWRSGQHAAWAVAAGAAASMAVLVRPTNVLVFLPLAVCLGTSSRRWLLLAMGGVPGAVLLLGYNAAVYGTPVATGYSDHAELFAWAHVLPSFRNYAAWLPIVLTPIGALSAALPALRHRAPRETTTLIVWAAAFLTLYAFYLYTQSTWWYLRFVLPAFPALIVAALLVARDVVLPRLAVSAPSWIARGASATAWPALLTAAILAHNGWWAERLVALEAGRGERKYYDVAQLTRSRLPPNAVVFAMQGSGALFYYTDFPVLRWDYLAPETLRRLQAEALAGGRPIYAVIFPFDMELNAFKDHLHGRWARIASVDDVTIWEFSGLDAPVRQTAGTPLD